MHTLARQRLEWDDSNMATVDFSKEADESKVYPAVHHFKVIVDSATFQESTLHAELANHDVRKPLARGRASSGGKYTTYEVSIHFVDRASHHRFDTAVKAIAGVKILL